MININPVWIEILVVFGGFLATCYSIHKNTEARKISLFHDMAKEERELHMRLGEIIMDIKREKEKFKEELNLFHQLIVEEYLNFFEHLALLINERKINEKLVLKYFTTLIKGVYSEYNSEICTKYTQLNKLITKLKEEGKLT